MNHNWSTYINPKIDFYKYNYIFVCVFSYNILVFFINIEIIVILISDL